MHKQDGSDIMLEDIVRETSGSGGDDAVKRTLKDAEKQAKIDEEEQKAADRMRALERAE